MAPTRLFLHNPLQKVLLYVQMPNAHAWGSDLTSNFGKNTYRSLAMRTSGLVTIFFTRTRTLIIVSHQVPFSFSLWIQTHLWLGKCKSDVFIKCLVHRGFNTNGNYWNRGSAKPAKTCFRHHASYIDVLAYHFYMTSWLMEKSLFVLRTLGIWSHNVQELWYETAGDINNFRSKHLTWCKFHKYSGFFSNGRHRFLNWTFTNSGAYHLPEFQAYLMSLRTRIAAMIRNPYLRLRILWP
ncbi:hypothetical protein VNO77_39281 [Canavalia gladiata]|uniref:Uncharacterized protein n=1 Tax=Canavalia gladiata TaxID=3824 RepID=A0AAN9PXM0_CANGL